jgi:hypothetical protein
LGDIVKTEAAKAIADSSSPDFFEIMVTTNSHTLPVIPWAILDWLHDQNPVVVMNKMFIAERIGAEQDPPLHFDTMTFSTSFTVKIDSVLCAFGTMTGCQMVESCQSWQNFSAAATPQ